MDDISMRQEASHEAPQFHTTLLITLTSPLLWQRILQEKVSRLVCRESSSPRLSQPPVTVLSTSHFRDMTNASTRFLIAPKMLHGCLLMQP